jgi:hypothetical protein
MSQLNEAKPISSNSRRDCPAPKPSERLQFREAITVWVSVFSSPLVTSSGKPTSNKIKPSYLNMLAHNIYGSGVMQDIIII